MSVLLPGTKVLARSSSKTWNTGTIVKEVKKERFLVEFPDSEQETIKQKYIVTSIQDVPADGVVHSQAFSRYSRGAEPTNKKNLNFDTHFPKILIEWATNSHFLILILLQSKSNGVNL